MTTPDVNLLDALRQVIGDEAMERAERWHANQPHDPTTYEDEATLRRSHGLSIGARREQRRPVPLKVDEYGWGNDGRWHPEFDGSAA